MDPELIREEYLKLIRGGVVKFNKVQRSWINYREYYRLYRAAKTKEERADIKKKVYSDKVRIK